MQLRKLLKEAVGHEFLGKTPTGAAFERLINLVREVVPGTVRYDVLEESLQHLLCNRIDEKLLDSFCWRIAGNLKRLKERRPVPPWHVQRVPEWVPTQIVRCRRQRNKRDEPGANYGFRILAGTSCSLTTYKWWSIKMIRYLSKEFGYTRPRGPNPARFPFSHPEQLVGLRIYILIDPKLCEREPGFTKISFSSTMKNWNKDIIKARYRALPMFVCMEGRTVAEPCHQCPIGFNKCQAATHREDWVQRRCDGCDDDDAWFDPENQEELCVTCVTKNAYRRNT